MENKTISELNTNSNIGGENLFVTVASGDTMNVSLSAVTSHINNIIGSPITGGTYTAGTATFTNNTGGTFTVTGFSTGSTSGTDIRVTGGTYTAGTATFRNNTGGTFTVTGFSTGSTSGTDIRVTGGTFSNGTATFRNNTGGTFTVVGFGTITTDKFVESGSYDTKGILSLNYNTGGGFSVVGRIPTYSEMIINIAQNNNTKAIISAATIYNDTLFSLDSVTRVGDDVISFDVALNGSLDDALNYYYDMSTIPYDASGLTYSVLSLGVKDVIIPADNKNPILSFRILSIVAPSELDKDFSVGITEESILRLHIKLYPQL